ncbi:hypothetical protein AB0I66_26970 [Streptomyces sp. NPDC050439]|uniref:hypothetical protein n=1 Tax=unclassified Streptomyces TaxID=2593676 RepID=UPI00342BA761
MAFSISAVVLFGFLLGLLIKFKTVGPGSAVVGVLFGYYLANSGAASTIDDLMSSLSHTISSF